MTRHVPAAVKALVRAASTATRRAATSIAVDRGDGPKSIFDVDDHDQALARHHGAT
jgi:hypothetical protein